MERHREWQDRESVRRSVQAGPLRLHPEARPERVEQAALSRQRPLRDGVLEGTFWVGTGTFDPQRTVPLKAGSFVRDVARGIHFDGTKDDSATLYFVGIGPAHPFVRWLYWYR